MFGRQKELMRKVDVVICTRCDLFWLSCPLPNKINMGIIWGLFYAPKITTTINDVFHIVPSDRLEEYMSFFEKHINVSAHSMHILLKQVSVLTDQQFLCNTEKTKNPFYFMVGRERSLEENTKNIVGNKNILDI